MADKDVIRWVGEQRLMHGYCGRAVVTGRAVVAGPEGAVGPATAAATGGGETARPVAVVKPAGASRDRVVRIGPRPAPAAHPRGAGDRTAAAAA